MTLADKRYLHAIIVAFDLPLGTRRENLHLPLGQPIII